MYASSFAHLRISTGKVSFPAADDTGGREKRARLSQEVDLRLSASTLHPGNINTRNEVGNGARVLSFFFKRVLRSSLKY